MSLETNAKLMLFMSGQQHASSARLSRLHVRLVNESSSQRASPLPPAARLARSPNSAPTTVELQETPLIQTQTATDNGQVSAIRWSDDEIKRKTSSKETCDKWDTKQTRNLLLRNLPIDAMSLGRLAPWHHGLDLFPHSTNALSQCSVSPKCRKEGY
jgi:hypothetical protein